VGGEGLTYNSVVRVDDEVECSGHGQQFAKASTKKVARMRVMAAMSKRVKKLGLVLKCIWFLPTSNIATSNYGVKLLDWQFNHTHPRRSEWVLIELPQLALSRRTAHTVPVSRIRHFSEGDRWGAKALTCDRINREHPSDRFHTLNVPDSLRVVKLELGGEVARA